jgi:hypothetical protein
VHGDGAPGQQPINVNVLLFSVALPAASWAVTRQVIDAVLGAYRVPLGPGVTAAVQVDPDGLIEVDPLTPAPCHATVTPWTPEASDTVADSVVVAGMERLQNSPLPPSTMRAGLAVRPPIDGGVVSAGEVDLAGKSAGEIGGAVPWRGAKGDRRAGRLGGTARHSRLRGGKGVVVAAGVGMAAVVVIGALVTAATAGGGGGGGGTDVAMVPVDDAAGGAPSTGSGDGSGGDGSGHGPPRPPFTKPDSPTTIADDGATDPGAEPGGDADAVVVSDPGPGTDPAPTPDPSGDPTPDPGPDPAPDPPADTTPPSIGGLTASPARNHEAGSAQY